MIWFAAIALLAGQDVDNLPADCGNAVTTVEVNACVALDLEREQGRMERYLAEAQRRARELDAQPYGTPTAQQAYLNASQTAWQAYAQIACEGVHDHWKDGTIRTVMYLDCRIEMIRERTHVIWRNYLTYADSTPPILPEPVESLADELRSAPPPPAPPSSPGS